MESFWRINVARRGKVISRATAVLRTTVYGHFFAVEVKGYNSKEFDAVYDAINRRFPAPEFNVSVTRWECTGKEIQF